MQRIFIKKCFLFAVSSVFRVERFAALVANISMMTKEVEIWVRKWLRQQSKDFYAAGFNALVKRWEICVLVEDTSRNNFFSGSNITCFMFYVHL
jgi:hypothetical protein